MLIVPRPCPAARKGVLSLVASALALAAAVSSAAAQSKPRDTTWKPVRSTTTWGLDLIEEGCRKSASFRALVDGLRDTDLVVYIQPARELPGVMVGVTELIGTAGQFRYLKVTIDARHARKRLISLIGHELQHATEIGGSRDVVDQGSLASFYRRIGDVSVDGYDTKAARDMGDTVYAELWRWRPEAGEAILPGRPADRPVYLDLTRR